MRLPRCRAPWSGPAGLSRQRRRRAGHGASGRITQGRLEANLSEHPAHARAGHPALTPREKARLGGILARLASPYDGERAAAGLLASAFVAKRGLAWADLAETLQPAAKAPAAPKETAPEPSPEEPSPGRDRRRHGSKTWRGFCRRRPATPGQALDRLA